MPSTPVHELAGFECWLVGTQAEVDAAVTGLRAAFAVVYRSPPARLTGADWGRQSVYVRAHLREQPPPAATVPRQHLTPERQATSA